MKAQVYLLLFLATLLRINAQNIHVIPQPNQISPEKGKFFLDRIIDFEIDNDFQFIKDELKEILSSDHKKSSKAVVHITKDNKITHKPIHCIFNRKKLALELAKKLEFFMPYKH